MRFLSKFKYINAASVLKQSTLFLTKVPLTKLARTERGAEWNAARTGGVATCEVVSRGLQTLPKDWQKIL